MKLYDFSQLFVKTNFTARKRKEGGCSLNYSAPELSYSNYNGRSKNDRFVTFVIYSIGCDKIKKILIEKLRYFKNHCICFFNFSKLLKTFAVISKASMFSNRLFFAPSTIICYYLQAGHFKAARKSYDPYKHHLFAQLFPCIRIRVYFQICKMHILIFNVCTFLFVLQFCYKCWCSNVTQCPKEFRYIDENGFELYVA